MNSARVGSVDQLSPKFMAMIVVALTVFVHALLIAVPSVNNEFAFLDATRFFITHERVLIDSYFSVQANPVTLPLLASGVMQLLPSVSPLVVMRLFGLVGLVLLSVGIQRICVALQRDDAPWVIVLLLFNPLIWIYSGRATVDFLPVALGVFAIGLVLRDDLPARRALLGGVLFGLAVVLKYHAVLMLMPVAALYLSGRIRMPKAWSAAVFLLPIAAMLAIYLFAVHERFGFWVTPPEFQSKHRLGFAGWLSNFICYAGFLALLTLPTLALLPQVRALLRRRWKILLSGLILLGVAGFLWVVDNGEMNLGPLDAYVPGSLRTSLFALIAAGIGLPLMATWRPEMSDKRTVLALWSACLAILMVFAMTRPAQRYLIFVLPFFLLTLPPHVLANRKYFVPALVLFCFGNAFVEYSRWCTGTASARMSEQIQERGWLGVTDPGAIAPHTGGEFYRTPRTSTRYTVVTGNVSGAVLVAKAGVPALTKYYSLIETPSAHAP